MNHALNLGQRGSLELPNITRIWISGIQILVYKFDCVNLRLFSHELSNCTKKHSFLLNAFPSAITIPFMYISYRNFENLLMNSGCLSSNFQALPLLLTPDPGSVLFSAEGFNLWIRAVHTVLPSGCPPPAPTLSARPCL